jgi:hypothetical protein
VVESTRFNGGESLVTISQAQTDGRAAGVGAHVPLNRASSKYARNIARYAIACQVGLMLTSVIVIGACADLTQVSNPDTQFASSFDNPAGAVIRYNGALAQFSIGFSYQVYFTGLLTDEFSDRTESQLIDMRTVQGTVGSLPYPYLTFSTARLDALHAIQTLERYNPHPSERIGEVWALLGYVETMFAENMCSGLPVGQLINGAPAYGPTLSRHEMVRLAITHFDSALAYARPSTSTSADSATSTIIRQLALVGKSRSLADSGDLASATTLASQVPVAFTYQPSFDTLSQTNFVFLAINQSLGASVSDREGINGLPFVSAVDPRVPTANIGTSTTDNLPIYAFLNYSGTGSPITLASGVEAQLLVAEAALQAGGAGVQLWANTLNQLRAAAITPAISPLTTDSTITATPSLQRAVMFRERAFWLFATGHRQGDLLRLIRFYGESPETVFPTGPYLNGTGTYGTAIVFTPSSAENVNPNFHGCSANIL